MFNFLKKEIRDERKKLRQEKGEETKKQRNKEREKTGLTRREIIKKKKLLGKTRRPVRFLGLVIQRKNFGRFFASLTGAIVFSASCVCGILYVVGSPVSDDPIPYILAQAIFSVMGIAFFTVVAAYCFQLAFSNYSTRKLVAIEARKKIQVHKRQVVKDNEFIESTVRELEPIFDSNLSLLSKFKIIFRRDDILLENVMNRLKEILEERQAI